MRRPSLLNAPTDELPRRALKKASARRVIPEGEGRTLSLAAQQQAPIRDAIFQSTHTSRPVADFIPPTKGTLQSFVLFCIFYLTLAAINPTSVASPLARCPPNLVRELITDDIIIDKENCPILQNRPYQWKYRYKVAS